MSQITFLKNEGAEPPAEHKELGTLAIKNNGSYVPILQITW